MNNTEEYYNGFYKELSKLDELSNTFEKIKSFLPELKGNESIVDIGCGHGALCFYAAQNGAREVVGIDTDEERIEIAKNV